MKFPLYNHLLRVVICTAIITAFVEIPKSRANNIQSPTVNTLNMSNNPEIDRLSEEVNKKREAADSWDTWNLRMLALAGVAAALLVVTALGVSRSNKDLNEASDRLTKAKESEFQTQLLLQGPRENRLNSENRRELVDLLKNFAGQKIDVRRSASVLMVNSKISSSSPIGDDTVGLADSLYGVLKDAGWILPPSPLVSGLSGHGIQVEVVQGSTPETISAVKMLVFALRKIPLEVSNPLLSTPEQAKRVSTDVILPEFGKDTIALTVLPR